MIAYRQKQIHDIHQTQHHIRDVVEAVNVSGSEEGAGDEMVSQHLVVILPPLLDVENEDLLHPERKLR